MDNGLQFNEQTLSQNLLAQKNPQTDTTVYYVGVYKQSQSGLLYNSRLLVLQDKNFNIFYSKHFRPVHQLSEMQRKGGSAIKEELSIANTSAEIEENVVVITFLRENIKQKWVFRFRNEKLALNWFILYKDINEKYIVKTIKSQTRETNTNSGHHSEYTSILSHNRYYQAFNPNTSLISSEQKVEGYSSVKKEKRPQKQEDCQRSEKVLPQSRLQLK